MSTKSFSSLNLASRFERGDALLAQTKLGGTQNIRITADLAMSKFLSPLHFGETWETGTTPTGPDVKSLAFGNGIFVAVGAYDTTYSNVKISTDGIAWTPILTAAPNVNFASIAFGNGIFVAVGVISATGFIYTSTDGTTWVSRTALPSHPWTAICFGGNLFLIVTGDGVGSFMATASPDGITWTPQGTPTNWGVWNQLVFGRGRFVVLGDPSRTNNHMYGVLVRLSDGVPVDSWQPTDGNPDITFFNDGLAPGLYTWAGVAYGDGMFVAIASSGTKKLSFSLDGANWADTSVVASISFTHIRFFDGYFYAFAINGDVYRFLPGANPTVCGNVGTGNVFGSAYGNGKLVVVKNTSSNSKLCALDMYQTVVGG